MFVDVLFGVIFDKEELKVLFKKILYRCVKIVECDEKCFKEWVEEYKKWGCI